jgi:hypothetical protein
MPNEAVQLDLRTDGLDSDDIDTAQDIVSNVGFQPNHHDVQVTNGTVNFQPFENTEANQELLEKCVERLNTEFSNADTQYEIRENRDRAMPASKRCTITVESGRGSGISGNNPEGAEDSDESEWKAFADSNGRENKRGNTPERTSYIRSADDSTSTNSDDDTEQQESDEGSTTPDRCIDCDSENIDSVTDSSEQFICSDCGLVMDRRNTEMNSTLWNEQERSDYVRAHWSEQTDTAVIGIITDPHRTHHEYYRIENPREFLKSCSGEREETQRIKQSDLEPFETLDLPPIDWRYTD